MSIWETVVHTNFGITLSIYNGRNTDSPVVLVYNPALTDHLLGVVVWAWRVIDTFTNDKLRTTGSTQLSILPARPGRLRVVGTEAEAKTPPPEWKKK